MGGDSLYSLYCIRRCTNEAEHHHELQLAGENIYWVLETAFGFAMDVDIHRALPCFDYLCGCVCRAALWCFTGFSSLVGAASSAAQAVQQ